MVVVTQTMDHQVMVVRAVVLVLGLVVVRGHSTHTILVLVQRDLHAKGMMVVIQTVLMQERPVVVAPVALVVIVRVVALLLVQVV